MKHSCPNSRCNSDKIIKDGSFFRPSDGRVVQRLRCKDCNKKFSVATFDKNFKQHKRRLNFKLRVLKNSGNSQRRLSLVLHTTRKTIARKLQFLGLVSRSKQKKFWQKQPKVKSIQFDELQTSERSKCLPVSIPIIVDSATRKILAFEVCSMPANGKLAKISRRKYGFRKDERREAIARMFEKASPFIDKNAKIISDEHPYYPPIVKRFFPDADYQRVKGRTGCIAGQGELKKIGFDPLFSLNHTCAMMRANINRLFRRTWCTTKSLQALADHIAIYVDYHNSVLT